jgi:hypothetical protein
MILILEELQATLSFYIVTISKLISLIKTDNVQSGLCNTGDDNDDNSDDD